MKINKNNYEAFFLDYHEGNLTPHQVADLLLFIEQHPELKEEFESFENIVLEEFPEIKFENKNNLKRNISDDLLISFVEGLLTKEESRLLDQQLLADAKLQQDFLLYQKTKLTADTSVIFENKKSLKRSEKKVIPIYYVIAAAASLLLLMGLFFMFNDTAVDGNIADKGVRSQKSETRSQEPGVENVVNEQSLIAENNKKEKETTSPINNAPVAKKKKYLKPVISNQPIRTDIHPGGQPVANNQQPIINNEGLVANTEQPIANNQQVSPTEKENTPGDIAIMKEKTTNKPIRNIEKKNNGFKKLTGWDLAQLAAKKINKLTGRKVEVKPTYNDEGDVTAYSLAAGDFQITRRR